MKDALDLVVLDIDDRVPSVRSLRLGVPGERGQPLELPSYTPGSHVVVECPVPGRSRPLANAYSLTGESVHPTTYDISVLHCPADEGGAGGSAWMHGLAVGDRVTTSRPRSAFAPVQRATRHVLVGAGIGVTPMVAHLRSAARWGREAELHYLFRAGRGAQVDDLKELGGDLVTFWNDRDIFVEHLGALLARQPIGTHLYVCGPAGFMDAVGAIAADLGWPPGRVHTEPFGIDALDPGEPFTVTVAGDDEPVEIPSGVSLLEALEERGHEVPNLCRQGVCGECRISVTSGAVHHRDLYLSEEQKRAGDAVMPCVSRADPTRSPAHLEVTL